MATAHAVGTWRRSGPASRARRAPRLTITGSVPSQKTAIIAAPAAALPVPAAVTTKA